MKADINRLFVSRCRWTSPGFRSSRIYRNGRSREGQGDTSLPRLRVSARSYSSHLPAPDNCQSAHRCGFDEFFARTAPSARRDTLLIANRIGHRRTKASPRVCDYAFTAVIYGPYRLQLSAMIGAPAQSDLPVIFKKRTFVSAILRFTYGHDDYEKTERRVAISCKCGRTDIYDSRASVRELPRV